MQGVYKVHENYIFTNEGHLVMVGAIKENSETADKELI